MDSDLRQGGRWRMAGVGPEGTPFASHGVYLVVNPPYELEFTWNVAGEPETKVRIELSESNGSTKVQLIHSGFATDENRNKYRGWPWLLDLLRSHVENPVKKVKP